MLVNPLPRPSIGVEFQSQWYLTDMRTGGIPSTILFHVQMRTFHSERRGHFKLQN